MTFSWFNNPQSLVTVQITASQIHSPLPVASRWSYQRWRKLLGIVFLLSCALIQPLAEPLSAFIPLCSRDMCMGDKEHLNVESLAGARVHPITSWRHSCKAPGVVMSSGEFLSRSVIHFCCFYRYPQRAAADAAPCSWRCFVSLLVHGPAKLFQPKEPLIMQIALLIAGVGTVLPRGVKASRTSSGVRDQILRLHV